MQIQPYLFFEGRCEEAIEFYRSTLAPRWRCSCDSRTARNRVLRQRGQGDAREPSHRRNDAAGFRRPLRRAASFQGFALSLTVSNEAEAERLFAALGDGGQVQMPMTKTFFSPRFGMVADRFGVFWMIYVATSV